MSILPQNPSLHLNLPSATFSDPTYSSEVSFLEIVTDCKVVIFQNTLPLTETGAFHIVTSMLLQKPVVLTRVPKFNSKVNSFYKHLILAKLNKIFVVSIDKLDQFDKESLLSNLSTTNYLLTKRETLTLAQIRKQYFRKLELIN